MPAKLKRYVSEVSPAYMTVADLRQFLTSLPDDIVVVTFDDDSGEFYPYPYPMERQVFTYGVFPSQGGFTYFDLVQPDDRNQPAAIQKFEGIVL